MSSKETGAKDNLPSSGEPTSARAWQACQPCRRRKVKCDGKQPCHNCSSRGQQCDFPAAKDHASVSRYYASSFEARCQQMEAMCQRLENISSQMIRATETLHRVQLPAKVDGNLNEDLVQAAAVLQSFPRGGEEATMETTTNQHQTPKLGEQGMDRMDPMLPDAQGQFQDLLASTGLGDDDSSVGDDLDDVEHEHHNPTTSEAEGITGQASALVTDSYGRLRFVGGATNKMLIDAAKGMSPTSKTHPHQTQTPGSNTLVEVGSLQESTPQENADVELPLFVRGKVWPELPYLPKPEQLSRPPQYISDLLIGLYFDKLHYTFPIVFKPHFMRSYGKLLRSSGNVDKEFLMVFYAVCACASGLLPTGSDQPFPGMEYYEKALLLHYASPGQASLEKVQCLGLLAMCTASWNTLTQSWSLAGQAVRSSMDIGLHINSKYMMPDLPATESNRPIELMRRQIARRTWWSVFCLERTVSICLGRPTAVDENDCCCELPLDLSDEDVEHLQIDGNATVATTQSAKSRPSPLTGFLAFARLCQISGRIQQLSSPLRLRQLTSFNSKKTKKYLSRVSTLDQSLRKWLEMLPDSVRFSANVMEHRAGGDSGLVMCVIIFILHAGSLLNLYRCLAHDPKRTHSIRTEAEMEDATAQCISAARSCINAAELVRDLVPPSHYLAICVHCLTLSGVALLCMSKQPPDVDTIADAELCVGYLKDLELRWSGAGRSRAIIEHLLAQSQRLGSGDLALNPDDVSREQWFSGHKRTFAEFDPTSGPNVEDSIWRDLPWSDVLDGNDLGQFSSWGSLL